MTLYGVYDYHRDKLNLMSLKGMWVDVVIGWASQPWVPCINLLLGSQGTIW